MKILPRFVWAAVALVLALSVSCSPQPVDEVPVEEPAAVAPGVDEGPSLYEQLLEIAIVEEMVMMPMRDGIRLATNIYRPKTSETTPVPTIFVKTPYNMNMWRDGEHLTGRYGAILEAVQRGYAYVNQNERGRYYSEGEWDILGPPTTDGYDALTWISNQTWSNGKVGTYGCYSTAEWQMGLAALDHPAHAAILLSLEAVFAAVGGWMILNETLSGRACPMLRKA